MILDGSEHWIRLSVDKSARREGSSKFVQRMQLQKHPESRHSDAFLFFDVSWNFLHVVENSTV